MDDRLDKELSTHTHTHTYVLIGIYEPVTECKTKTSTVNCKAKL